MTTSHLLTITISGDTSGVEMKVRFGFVSNSSSSSFIVAFRDEPKDGEDILRMFGLKKEMQGTAAWVMLKVFADDMYRNMSKFDKEWFLKDNDFDGFSDPDAKRFLFLESLYDYGWTTYSMSISNDEQTLSSILDAAEKSNYPNGFDSVWIFRRY